MSFSSSSSVRLLIRSTYILVADVMGLSMAAKVSAIILRGSRISALVHALTVGMCAGMATGMLQGLAFV